MTASTSTTERSGMATHSWRVDKTINLSHLLTSITIAGAVFLWLTTLDQRVTVNTQAISNLDQKTAQAVEYLKQEQMDNQRDIQAARGELRDEIRQLSLSVNSKLDRLMERGNQQ